MITEIEKLLNIQIGFEANASMQYLAMACWADLNGFNGIATFFYTQSEEERLHMTKLVKFINERNGEAIIPALEKPKSKFDSLHELFEVFLKQEEFVTEHINKIIFECLNRQDYNVHNFMQWYVAEQLEEEAMARTLLDKLKIIGDDKSGHYLFDRDINAIAAAQSKTE
ncbi:ferritin [Urechidicola croceus]|uniref:Ferritin n=1 Tax=Urechidicola croceus TaxID=1850246 RepID=A0A1D8P4Z5_9FLAO|nr:ferritin [Urechidicola croceus]AOW19659.1 ferritin [Urechidicola croceus]